jgi:large subunit ribosomal protein L5
MKERFGYSNNLQVPRLEKIVLSQGIGAAVADKKLVDAAVEEMTLIAGQRAVPTKSKKDISNFKLRKGMPVGARVTLRGTKMYDFLERLLVSSLPRIRDFQGIKEGFDGRGNFTFGVTEQIIFPEIEIDKVNRISGMDITLVSSAKTDMECKALLQEFGMPFKK